MTGAVKMSPAVTAKPAPASTAAIEARVREVVLVTRASGSAALRSRSRAATAPASGCHDTVSTPSMSISTAPMRPAGPIRSVPQDPQALRFALPDVAPAVDPAAGGEQGLAAAEHRPARPEQHLDEAADHPDELGALVGERGLDGRRPRQRDEVGAHAGLGVVEQRQDRARRRVAEAVTPADPVVRCDLAAEQLVEGDVEAPGKGHQRLEGEPSFSPLHL